MYNRYIPQSDGTYRKNRVSEQRQPEPPKSEPVSQRPHPECPQEVPKPTQGRNVGGFLRNILPREFDTGDLIVVLLLLLMAEHCEEDKNTALLTLALYLFM